MTSKCIRVSEKGNGVIDANERRWADASQGRKPSQQDKRPSEDAETHTDTHTGTLHQQEGRRTRDRCPVLRIPPGERRRGRFTGNPRREKENQGKRDIWVRSGMMDLGTKADNVLNAKRVVVGRREHGTSQRGVERRLGGGRKRSLVHIGMGREEC